MKKIINYFNIQSKSKKIISIVIALLLVFCVFTTIKTYFPQHIKSSYIIKEIKESSELTTAKITYTGFHKYEDEGARFLNRGDFTMTFDATNRTGINLDEVKVKVNNFTKKVKITIPEAKVLDINVDESSIQFYDTKFALFNFDSREDVTKAINEAKEDAKEKVANKVDFDFANKQSEVLIRGLVQQAIPSNYEIVVEIK